MVLVYFTRSQYIDVPQFLYIVNLKMIKILLFFACLITFLNPFALSAPINEFSSSQSDSELRTSYNHVAKRRQIFGDYQGFVYGLAIKLTSTNLSDYNEFIVGYSYDGYSEYAPNRYTYNNRYHRRRNPNLLPLSVITIG